MKVATTALANFLNVEKDATMDEAKLIQILLDYVKQNNLADGEKIKLDDRLRKLFGTEDEMKAFYRNWYVDYAPNYLYKIVDRYEEKSVYLTDEGCKLFNRSRGSTIDLHELDNKLIEYIESDSDFISKLTSQTRQARLEEYDRLNLDKDSDLSYFTIAIYMIPHISDTDKFDLENMRIERDKAFETAANHLNLDSTDELFDYLEKLACNEITL